MLKLTAEVQTTMRLEHQPPQSLVATSLNGTDCGLLNVPAEQADELVGLLNAATELLHACNFMWRQAVMEGKTCSGDPNKPEYDRAKAAIDIAEAKGGAR